MDPNSNTNPNLSPETPPRHSRPPQPSADTNTAVRPSPDNARRYPKPPILPLRLIMLCLRPESWAEAARYPTRITVIPLILAILIAGIAVGAAESTRALRHMHAFATHYDTYYPPLEFSNGTLRATGDLPAPIRFDNGTGGTIFVDPTGKTSPEQIKAGPSFFVSDKDIWIVGGNDQAPYRFSSLAPFSSLAGSRPHSVALAPAPSTGPAFVAAAAPAPVVINSASLTQYVRENTLSTAILGTVLMVFFTGAVNVIWALLMMLLICPLVLLGAAGPKIGEGPDRRLILPRRAAYRMAAAVLVPLILLGGFLHAAGRPVFSLLGLEGATLFWFFSAASLALWAGILAKRLYSPPAAPRRAT